MKQDCQNINNCEAGGWECGVSLCHSLYFCVCLKFSMIKKFIFKVLFMLFNCVLVFMIMAETQFNLAEAKGGIYCNWAVKQTRGKGGAGLGQDWIHCPNTTLEILLSSISSLLLLAHSLLWLIPTCPGGEAESRPQLVGPYSWVLRSERNKRCLSPDSNLNSPRNPDWPHLGHRSTP